MVILDSLSGCEGLERLDVSEGAKAVLSWVLECPMGSVGDYVALGGLDQSRVYARLWELQALGLVEYYSLGATRGKVNRWWVSQLGLERLGLMDLAWQQPGSLGQLLGRLPSVKWFYGVAASLPGMGRLESFQWFTGSSWDAAVRFERGWVALFWSGLLQTEGRLRQLFSGLAGDLRRYSVEFGAARPGLLVFVASDLWQRELVLRTARLFGVEGMVQVRCVKDESVRGAVTVNGSAGWVYQSLGYRDEGGWALPDRLADCLWSQGFGVGSNRLLDLVAEWPKMKSAFGRRCFAGDGGSKYVLRLLRELVGMSLVKKEGERSLRYRVSGRGYSVLAARDRVPSGVMLAGVKGPEGAAVRRMELHEDGVMFAVGGMIEGGLSVASGWRSWEGVEGGAIVPDAMVYVTEGPYGPGWHYLEYERYVRGEFRARRKLRGYAANDRREVWPLMIVVWDEVVEGIFHRVGSELGVLMLTSTMERLRRHGPVGNAMCWSMYGRGVYVGAW